MSGYVRLPNNNTKEPLPDGLRGGVPVGEEQGTRCSDDEDGERDCGGFEETSVTRPPVVDGGTSTVLLKLPGIFEPGQQASGRRSRTLQGLADALCSQAPSFGQANNSLLTMGEFFYECRACGSGLFLGGQTDFIRRLESMICCQEVAGRSSLWMSVHLAALDQGVERRTHGGFATSQLPAECDSSRSVAPADPRFQRSAERVIEVSTSVCTENGSSLCYRYWPLTFTHYKCFRDLL